MAEVLLYRFTIVQYITSVQVQTMNENYTMICFILH